MLRLLLHGGSTLCMQPPDWRVQLDAGVWRALDVSGQWPSRGPWWTERGMWAPSRSSGAIHILIAWGGEGDLPTGPAEVAGELCARLMEGYDLQHPRAHYAQGRCDSPGGLALPVPPGDCPTWAWWGPDAAKAFEAERERLRRPLDRRWVRDGLGGGGG